MMSEIKSVNDCGTWKLVNLPEEKKANVSVVKYKARLCAKGYTQKFGEDYSKMFAPAAIMTSIRVMLSIAAEME